MEKHLKTPEHKRRSGQTEGTSYGPRIPGQKGVDGECPFPGRLVLKKRGVH